MELLESWKFQPDPTGEGEALGYHAVDKDDSLWREVTVPCVFDDIGEEFSAYVDELFEKAQDYLNSYPKPWENDNTIGSYNTAG